MDFGWNRLIMGLYPVINRYSTCNDMGVVGHAQKTQTPTSSAKWKKQKHA